MFSSWCCFDSKGSEAPWKDLPSSAIFMRDEWKDSPIVDAVDESSADWDDDRPLSLNEWVNLNFAARVIRDIQPSFRTFGIWELRSGLEDFMTNKQGKLFPQASSEARVRIASEWIIRAGDRIW